MTAAIDDVQGDVFRCDYCGQFRPLRDAMIFWRQDYELHDGTVWTSAIYCSEFCGQNSAFSRVGG
jgi:hypothetical protein